jgi:hypothetical protein
MQPKQSFKVIQTTVIVFSLAYILYLIGFIDANSSTLISYGLLFYGVISVYLSIGTAQKGYLFFNTLVFMTGVVFFLTENFVFINPVALLIPAVYFILSAGFIILYIDNYSEKLFLMVAGSSFVVGFIIILLYGNYNFRILLQGISDFILKFYPLAIILLGLFLFFRRTESNSPESK